MTTSIPTQRRSGSFLAPAVLACSLLAAGAMAAPPAEQGRSVRVSYADLNLSSPAGAAVLYGRIKRAAGLVCGAGSDPIQMQRHLIWRACVSGAIANAVATVDSPQLTALHVQATGDKTLTAALIRR